jgi:opacity protein-like surface antigen
MKQLFIGAALGALLALPAAAQTRRSVFGWQLWPEAQAEVALPGNDYLLFSLRGQNLTDNNGFSNASRVLGFDERRLTVGYEHFWNEHWSIGATAGYISANKTYALLPEVLLRHRSPIGPLTFGQRLSLEREIPGASGAAGRTNARLRVDLEKIVSLGRLAIRPRLSYEALAHVRLLRADTDAKERTIDYTSLRGEVGVRLTDWLDATPWVARQTGYSFGQDQFDIDGNVTIPAGRTNAVSPVLGLDVRFTFLKGQDAATRQQLPTQH